MTTMHTRFPFPVYNMFAILFMLPACVFAQPEEEPALQTALEEFQLVEHNTPVRELLPDYRTPQKLVVVVDNPARTAWLQAAMPAGVQVIGVARDADTLPHIADADAVVQSACRPADFEGARQLQWIHAGGAGSDHCLAIAGVSEGHVVLTNSQKVKNTGLAEMAIGHVVAMARTIDITLENQRRQQFGAIQGRRAKRFADSTMLIVGLGGAGTEIARLAHGLGMNIIATRNSSREGPDFVTYVGLADELPELLPQADFVVISTPLTPATRGLFDADMLALMKNDAMLVNWARAEIVVKDDLEQALRNGVIGSAALNWATYATLPEGDSLWTTPNLLLTPWGGSGQGAEAAGENSEIEEKRWLVIRENMRRFATGEPLYSVFDLERGY